MSGHAEAQQCMQVLFEAQGRGGKNKAVDLEDMKFHQCVRLARFENDRTISFIPPDGAFDLMYASSSWSLLEVEPCTRHALNTERLDFASELTSHLEMPSDSGRFAD